MNLNPKHTEAFRAVIDSGSFEQAAMRLHLTSPAISQRAGVGEHARQLVVRSRPAPLAPGNC
jgi:LysR family transcriptional regulator (chromosome initiation inhibitor)